MKVVGYLRVSTGEQSASGLGLEAQRRSIRTEADRRGWEVEWISDEGVSGGTPPADRPGLGTALASVEPEDVLVVARLDRLGRSALDVISLARQAEDEGWHVVILDLGLDTTTPMGRFTLTMLAGVAELQRDMIRERTREALASLKARGERVGRPRGTPDEVVELIVSLREDGLSLRAIAGELNERGIPTTRGGKQWYGSVVSSLLRSVELEAELAAAREEAA